MITRHPAMSLARRGLASSIRSQVTCHPWFGRPCLRSGRLAESTAGTLRMDDRPASGIRRATWYLFILAKYLAALALAQNRPHLPFYHTTEQA